MEAVGSGASAGAAQDECGGVVVGSGNGGLGVVAPNFADFAGKCWERRFPELLAQYYTLLGVCFEHGAGAKGAGLGVEGAGMDGFVLREGSGGARLAVYKRPYGYFGHGRNLGLELVHGYKGGLPEWACGDDQPVVGSGGGDSSDDSAGPQLSGSGDVKESVASPKRGKWYDHNKAKKERKKKRHQESSSSSSDWRRRSVDAVSDGSRGLRASLEKKWIEENELAALKAVQQRELLEARDMEKIKKMQAAQVMRTTEQAKVQTEKAFGFLAKTGNVPGVVGEGFVEGTVLTNATPGLTRSAGDTISPDSSASMHEYRQALKAVADSEKKIADLERALARLRIVVPEETAEAERYAGARTTFTLDTDGEPPVADDGFVGDDGKYHTYQRLTHPDWTPSTEKMMAKKGLDMYYDDCY